MVRPNITLEATLDRTVAVVKLWESLKETQLRNILLKLGIDRKATEQLEPTKLLATFGRRAGFRWPDDSSSFVKEWDKDLRFDCFARLFAVNQLRQKAACRTGDDVAASLAKDLDAFGIVEAAQAGGWGHAVDTVYDRLIADINAIAGLLAHRQVTREHLARHSNPSMIKSCFVKAQVANSAANWRTSTFLRRLVFSVVDEVADAHYGAHYPSKCFQASAAIRAVLDWFGIRSRLWVGTVCVAEAFEYPGYATWGGFWDQAHHLWLTTQYDELEDLSIVRVHRHPRCRRSDGIAMPSV